MKAGETESLNVLRRAKGLEFPTYGHGMKGWDETGSTGARGIALSGAMSVAGFALTAIFVFVTIISPEQFGNEWSDYHALTYLGSAIVLLSLPGIFHDARLRSSTQIYLLLGFIVAMGFSEAANGWLGGALVTWRLFLSSSIVFFFIVANVTTARRLKMLILTVIASCLVVVVEALCGYYLGFRGRTFLIYQHMISDRGQWGDFGRIRGAGFLSDPNDFAQFLLIALPLTTIQWRGGRRVFNFLMVAVPAALLMWAIFLTHSRGALVALALLALVSIRKRFGAVLSVIFTTIAILGMFALNFTGGRLISADAGADRLWLWASGLEMFKRAPLFGVGFNKFAEFAELTAHNSFVLCLAELGFIGCTLWVALLVTTMMGLTRMIQVRQRYETERSAAGNMALGEKTPSLQTASCTFEGSAPIPIESHAAMNFQTGIQHAFDSDVPARWIIAMRLALISFVATSWFLSRTYQSTMYVILGLATATILLDKYGDEPVARVHWVTYTLAIEAAAIAFIYFVVRFRF